MTANQQAYRKQLIKYIHISKRYANYYKDNKDQWQELLSQHFCVRSSKDLDISCLKALLEYCNFRSDFLELPRSSCAKSYEVAKMRRYWGLYARNASELALLKFLNRNFNLKLKKLEDLPRFKTPTILGVLKKISKRY